MCGIVAFSGEKEFDPNKIATLLAINQTRGLDSWGHCSIVPSETKGSVVHKSYKQVGKLIDSLNDLKLIPSKEFISHVRARTKGVVSVDNAHPFQYKDEGNLLTGVHNGTIENWIALEKHMNDKVFTEKQKKLHGVKINFSVDSQLLFYSILCQNNYEFLEKIEGGTAFSMLTRGSLRVYTNGGRTLFRGTTEEGIYFSSIEEPLLFLGMTDVEPIEWDSVLSYSEGKLVKSVPIEKKPLVKVTTTGHTDSVFFRVFNTKEAINKKEDEGYELLPFYKSNSNLAYYPKTDSWVCGSLILKDFEIFKKSEKNLSIIPMTRVSDINFIKGLPGSDPGIIITPLVIDKKGIYFDFQDVEFNLFKVYPNSSAKVLTIEKEEVTLSTGVLRSMTLTEYSNGTKRFVPNSFVSKAEDVQYACIYFDYRIKKFLKCTTYSEHSWVEEEVTNFEDLYGISTEEYLKRFPDTSVESLKVAPKTGANKLEFLSELCCLLTELELSIILTNSDIVSGVSVPNIINITDLSKMKKRLVDINLKRKIKLDS